MFDPVPWFVGGGAEHSPEVARLLAYAATNGSSGIVGAGDCNVTALPVPGGAIRASTGGVVIPNKYAGGSQQTYIARSASVTDVAIAPTTSSGGRTDLIIARIDDPQYGGTAPVDPTVGPYVRVDVIQNVSSAITDIPVLTYPAIALARVTIPVSTATITQGMITDLRNMANPRRQRSLNTLNLTATEVQTSVDPTDGEQWPNEAGWSVQVPTWATQVRIRADWGQVIVPPGSADGFLWVQIGLNTESDRVITQRVNYNTPDATSYQRSSYICADTRPIPATMRGTVRLVNLRAYLASGLAAARISVNGASAVVCDLEFLEAPAQDVT